MIVFLADGVVLSPNLVLSTRHTSLVAVRWASKKSGGSSKNLGGRSPGKRYGFKKVEGTSEYRICISLGSSQLLSPDVCQLLSVSAGGGQDAFPGERRGGSLKPHDQGLLVGGQAESASPHHEPAGCQPKLPTENVLWF